MVDLEITAFLISTNNYEHQNLFKKLFCHTCDKNQGFSVPNVTNERLWSHGACTLSPKGKRGGGGVGVGRCTIINFLLYAYCSYYWLLFI